MEKSFSPDKLTLGKLAIGWTTGYLETENSIVAFNALS